MKKMKIALWLILLVVIALIIFQNKDFFSAKQSLTFNSYVAEPYHTPPLQNAVWFLACFIIGLLIAYFFSLMERFKSNRVIKELRAKNESLLDLISQLRKELESRQAPQETATEEIPVANVETVAGNQPETE